MQIFNKVRDTILQYWDSEPEAITTEASIKEDIGADAIAVVDIMMELEEAYNISIPDKKIGLRVGALVDYIKANSPVAQIDDTLPTEEKMSA